MTEGWADPEVEVFYLNMILITDEIQHDERLNWPEKALLGFYRYWTVKGELHYCCISDKCVMEELHIPQKSFYRMKKHLRELDLIECEGGKVVYKMRQKVSK